METDPTRSNRRTLLQRGLALVGGALGLTALEGKARGDDAVISPPAPGALKLYADLRPAPVPSGAHVIRCGELRETPEGKAVGDLYTNGFCLETPLGPHYQAASNIEFQTFRLEDGTLFGIGAAGPMASGEKTRAVLGGTGRFAGARGSYVERTAASAAGGPGTLEIILTLTT